MKPNTTLRPAGLAAAVGAALLAASLGAAAQGSTNPASPANPTSPTSPNVPPGTTGGAGIPGSTGTTPPAAATASRADRGFVEEAARDSMAEVTLGELAQQRASNPQVKEFGSRMVQDHTKARDELTRIAQAKGVQIPTLDRSQRRDADRLGKLSGAEFDRAYMKHMVDDHKKVVDEFEKASRSVQDREIKDFATRTLPTLQTHLQMAQSTYDAVKNTP
jgi:putative membrane protein